MGTKEENRKEKLNLLLTLAMEDFRNKYAGSFIGTVWAFVNPLMTILIYWFIFQVGFKSAPVEDYPFVLWLVSGLLPWFLISEVLPGSTACLAQYSYLVKKIAFDVRMLPLIKILSGLIIQVFLIVITIVIFCFCGFMPDLYYLQILPYLLYTCLLVMGVGYFTAALYAFFRDILQIVNIGLQILFWLTPIVWNYEIMPPFVQKIIVLNPVYYVVSGYRSAFIYKSAFFQNTVLFYYYWILVIVIAFLGRKFYSSVKEHFADVL